MSFEVGIPELSPGSLLVIAVVQVFIVGIQGNGMTCFQSECTNGIVVINECIDPIIIVEFVNQSGLIMLVQNRSESSVLLLIVIYFVGAPAAPRPWSFGN